MGAWKDSLRHITVNLSEWNNAQRWATLEVRVGLNFGAIFRYQDIQLGLYADGDEVAVGYPDAQGYWRIRVEALRREPETSIFEVQARLSLGRAQNQERARYAVNQRGLTVNSRSKGQAESPRSASSSDSISPTGGESTGDAALKFALPKMLRVRAGTFWMGRSGYAHRVRITRALEVASVPVTQELYTLIMNQTPSQFKGDQRPVEQVSFWESIVFCNKLSERCGYNPAYLFYQESGRPCVEWSRSSNGFRLLTEAEWEYVAKASAESTFAGGERLDELGWYQDNSKSQTHKVGQKSPNKWGLFDCSGNVWEWCFDEWDETAYVGRKGTLNQDPLVLKTPDAERRVRRGGSWVAFNINCSTSYRFWGRSAAKIDDTGFRIARSL